MGIIRELWAGSTFSHRGSHFGVEAARLYTLPASPPAIYVAAGRRHSAEVAGRIGDGLIGVAPNSRVVDLFEARWRAGQAPARSDPRVLGGNRGASTPGRP